jgi:prepilin-type N-terminal cleavage/methylation domain-containing protein
MTRLRLRLRSHAAAAVGDAAGFTLIEVMVAMLVTLIVIGGVASGFVRNNDSALAGQRDGQLLALAQKQIESVRGIVSRYGFSTLAMTSTTAAPTDAILPSNPADPNDFVKNYNGATPSLLIEKNYNETSGGQISNAPSLGEPLEIDAVNGRVTPRVNGVVAGSATTTAKVYTYVTKATVPCLTSLGSCAADDVRRVVVAVVLDNATGTKSVGTNAPVYLSTIFSDPIPTNQPSSASGLRLGLNIG